MIIAVNFAIGTKKPEKIRASTGFEQVTSVNTGAMLYHLCYEATHWERGQFIEFKSSLRSEMKWSICGIIHISMIIQKRQKKTYLRETRIANSGQNSGVVCLSRPCVMTSPSSCVPASHVPPSQVPRPGVPRARDVTSQVPVPLLVTANNFFLVNCLETAYVTSQNDCQTQILSRQIVILAGHCPLTSCYFEPCTRGKEKIFWPQWESNPNLRIRYWSWVRFPLRSKYFSLPCVVPWFPLLGLKSPSGLFMGLVSTLIYTSELILCSTAYELWASWQYWPFA